MLPYFQQPVFSVGSLKIHAFAVLAVTAILAARWILLRRGRRLGLKYQDIAPFYLSVVITGLAGAIVVGFFSRPAGLSSLGAIAGGLDGALLCCWVRHCSVIEAMTLFDLAAFAAPFAGSIIRLGCTIAHDHRGLPSGGWLAFQFPEGGRYDLGFMDFLFLSALSLVFLFLGRKPKPSLFFLGLSACAYSVFRIWRDTLDVPQPFLPWLAVFLVGAAAFGLPKLSRSGRRLEAHGPEPLTR